MGKTQRQHLVMQILTESPVTNQSQLVEVLAGHGVDATQATVSRDLDELGAVKVRIPGGDLVYAIPDTTNERPAPEEQLRRVLSDWVVSVAVAGPLVVLRTPPGSAHVVGSALDRSGRPEVVGTVAGDDTIFIAVDDTVGAPALARWISDLVGLNP